MWHIQINQVTFIRFVMLSECQKILTIPAQAVWSPVVVTENRRPRSNPTAALLERHPKLGLNYIITLTVFLVEQLFHENVQIKKKLTNPMQIESAETDSSASAVDCYYMAASQITCQQANVLFDIFYIYHDVSISKKTVCVYYKIIGPTLEFNFLVTCKMSLSSFCRPYQIILPTYLYGNY